MKQGIRKAVVALVLTVGVVAPAACSSAPPETPAESSARVDQQIRDAGTSTCEKSVKQQLKDPDSADFRNEKVTYSEYESKYTIVGEVNANNSFGGKVGYQVFGCDVTYDKATDNVHAEAHLVDANG